MNPAELARAEAERARLEAERDDLAAALHATDLARLELLERLERQRRLDEATSHA